ncbi:RsmB/NOP family class I SAM-dependent RNA methyltransferase [Candidatus Micrarchaeota archaeon]|nr:RsmB/NOP family class I SAM-dependent RNA methyltransferase [Candidatus Micrarchaeota archaeon]
MDEKEYKDWLSSYTDYDKCLNSFYNQKQFFRLNTLKINSGEFYGTSKIKYKKSPYYDLAFELEEDSSFAIGKTWEYFLGYIYPQSLSSILVSLVLDPMVTDKVLDVAASPGSKFSHMAMLMDNKGVLVGNERDKEKLSALYSTINRLNILNCIVTLRDGGRLNWKGRFSKVLLDAPCTALGSGEGASKRWEIEHSARISGLQKRMLFNAYDALKPGGQLVYSTCTYAKEENEEVVLNLLENVPNAKLEVIDSKFADPIPHEQGLSDYGDEFKKCYRIYPQHIESEGFFIAKIKKGE